MLRSPNKRCDSDSDLFNLTSRKRKHDDEMSESFRTFTECIMKKLECWKDELDTKITNINDNLNNVIKQDLSKLTQTSNDMRTEINNIHKEYAEIKQSVQDLHAKQEKLQNNVECLQNSAQFSSDQHDELNSKVDSITNDVKIIGDLQNELKDLRKQNNQLTANLNSNDQRDRLLNLEIKGIPESKNENTNEVTLMLLQKLVANVTENDIISTNRVSPRINVQGRPRVIIAKMSSRLVKDNILSRSRKLRLTTKDINVCGDPKPIYISEHLTSYNKMLLKKM